MNSYNTKFVSLCPKQTSNSVRMPEEVDQAMEALAATSTAIAMAITETAYSLILFCEKIRNQLHFQSFNHQKQPLVKSAQENYHSAITPLLRQAL